MEILTASNDGRDFAKVFGNAVTETKKQAARLLEQTGGCFAVRFMGALRLRLELSGSTRPAGPHRSGAQISLGLAFRRRSRPGAVLGHELVELLLVLGMTQTIEEIAEFGLLFLEPPQGLHAVFIEGAVAAGGRAETETTAFHVAAHALHLVLHPLHFILPTILMIPATHVRAPEGENEKDKADRPPEKESENGPDHHSGMDTHPGAVHFAIRAAPLIEICGVGHFPLRDGIRRC
jgi:hypothetical protein